MAKILIDSIYINNSGGKVLLDYFIKTTIDTNCKEQFHFLLDKRGSYNYLEKISYEFGDNSEMFRYRFYKDNKKVFSAVLCFGNVPPPVNISAKVFVYFHNVLLAESLKDYPIKNKFFKYLKRSYIRCLGEINRIKFYEYFCS